MQQSFGAQPASQELPSMCLTDKQHHSSHMSRQWAFLILKRAGYPHPHEVTIINAPSTPTKQNPLSHQACAYASTKIIHFNERNFAGKPIGVKLATIGHEAIHIAQNDNPKEYKDDPQPHELYADQVALQLGGCGQCGLEITEHYLNEQDKSKMHFFNDKSMPKSIQELHAATADQLANYIKSAHSVSKTHYNTHPCEFERAYCLYQLAQTSALKDNLCQFHQSKNAGKKMINQTQ